MVHGAGAHQGVGHGQAAIAHPPPEGRVRRGRRHDLEMLVDLGHRLEVVHRCDGKLLHERNRDALAPHLGSVRLHGRDLASGSLDAEMIPASLPSEGRLQSADLDPVGIVGVVLDPEASKREILRPAFVDRRDHSDRVAGDAEGLGDPERVQAGEPPGRRAPRLVGHAPQIHSRRKRDLIGRLAADGGQYSLALGHDGPPRWGRENRSCHRPNHRQAHSRPAGRKIRYPARRHTK